MDTAPVRQVWLRPAHTLQQFFTGWKLLFRYVIIHPAHLSQILDFHHPYQMLVNKFLMSHWRSWKEFLSGKLAWMCLAMHGKILQSSLQTLRICKLFFSQLNDVADRKPGILSLVPLYSSKFVQAAEHKQSKCISTYHLLYKAYILLAISI